MKTCTLVLTTAFLCSAAQGPGGDAAKDLDQLQGEWAPVHMVSNGVIIKSNQAKAYKMTIKGKTMTFSIGDQGGTKEIVLNPKEKPRAIDMGAAKIKGIYAIDGDIFSLCYSPKEDGPRPTAFESKQGSDTVYEVWKRVK